MGQRRLLWLDREHPGGAGLMEGCSIIGGLPQMVAGGCSTTVGLGIICQGGDCFLNSRNYPGTFVYCRENFLVFE